MDFDQFMRSWLIGFLFCLGLSLGSMALLMLQHLSGGQWGLVSRRVFEAATRNLPIVALLFIPIVLRLPVIFEWARPEAVDNAIIQAKAGYLNQGFFIVRALLYFAFWMTCMVLLNRWSAEQDSGRATTPADSVRFRTLSAPGLLFLVLTVTFASVDWIMSLDAEWFSTIFGFLTIAGWGLTAFAFTVIVLAMLERAGVATDVLKPRHFHDLGKLLLAFIDAVGIPELLAVPDHLVRQPAGRDSLVRQENDRIVGLRRHRARRRALHAAVPASPIAGSQKAQRMLARVAMFIICMRMIDLIWLVEPEFRPGTAFPIHWLDVTLLIGLTGVWMFMFTRNLRSRAICRSTTRTSRRRSRMKPTKASAEPVHHYTPEDMHKRTWRTSTSTSISARWCGRSS